MNQILLYDVIPDDFKPAGALEDCFKYYPHFADDFELLVKEGYVRIISPKTCKWLKSRTCLAEYLYLIIGCYKVDDNDEGFYDYYDEYDTKPPKIKKPHVPGGFWAPAEKAFEIERHSLRKLVGMNGNELKPKKSRAYKNIKSSLLEHRALLKRQQKQNEKDLKILELIKNTIVIELDIERPQTISQTLKKIHSIFSKNVDKKITKP
jgi:hypothetical protein